MKKIFVLLILFGVSISCKKKEQNFSEEMIEKLADIDNELPSRYGFLDLYVMTNNHEILKTNVNYLFEFYKRYYNKKFKTFAEFLNAILNSDFIFDKNISNKIIRLNSFKLNPKIEKKYSQLGFDKFLDGYSKKTSRKKLELNKSIIQEDEYLTVVYLLYKNLYDVNVDCYIGKDYIREREKTFNSLQ